MPIEFTAHNIRLKDGSFTKPGMGAGMETDPWFVSAKRVLETVFPGNKSRYRLADLGCLEGGYAVEFARMGFQVLGLEVRESNFAACQFVKANIGLENLSFTKDDAWNIARYGTFDAIFCCGLLYHLDRPKQFLVELGKVASRLLIVQSHFSVADLPAPAQKGSVLAQLVSSMIARPPRAQADKFNLSPMSENEQLPGRWFKEFHSDAQHADREKNKWASWDNRSSFWIQKEYLLQAIYDAGFDLVLEQMDSLAPEIAIEMTHGYYKTDSRGTFIGIKTGEH